MTMGCAPLVRTTASSVTSVSDDDAGVAARFVAGDPEAVRALYQAHGRLVFSIAYKMLGDVGLAEDATQQTFVQAWRAAGSFAPGRPFAAWITTIAKRVAIDVYRRERRHRRADRADLENAVELMTPAADEQVQNALEVQRALSALPAAERDLLRMQHYDQLTQAEIAQALDLPIGTVKSRASRAHRRLADMLEHLRADTDQGGGGRHE